MEAVLVRRFSSSAILVSNDGVVHVLPDNRIELTSKKLTQVGVTPVCAAFGLTCEKKVAVDELTPMQDKKSQP